MGRFLSHTHGRKGSGLVYGMLIRPAGLGAADAGAGTPSAPFQTRRTCEASGTCVRRYPESLRSLSTGCPDAASGNRPKGS